MTETVRYGLIGAGMMGREHLRNLQLIPGSRVTALSDPNESSRAASARTAGNGVAVFSDHRALLESDLVDAIIVASPNDTHRAILDDVFSGPKALPILVEKPVCTTMDDCADLSRAAREHRAPVWVAMEYRYMPPVAELVARVRGGEAGRLRMLAIREHRYPFLHKVDAWNRFARRSGGTLVEKCCHFFDLMRLIAEDEPVRVYASGAMDVNYRDESYEAGAPDVIDNAFVVVDFRDGTRAMLDLCMFAEGSWFQEEIAAVGDRGKVECLVPGPARFWPGGAERDAEIAWSPRDPKGPVRRKVPVDETVLRAGDHHGSTFFQHQRFRRAVVDGAPVEVTMEDGLRAVAIGLAAERSIAERRAVALDGLAFA